MTTTHQLYRDDTVILLDFDGPITRLLTAPHNAALAARARTTALAGGMTLSLELQTTTDHLALLRAAHAHASADCLAQVEAVCSAGETTAAHTSPITAGVTDFLHAAHADHKPVIVVTNNHAGAVHAFLERHHLTDQVTAIHGRDPHHVDQLKPHPALLHRALEGHRDAHALMIGDTPTDITAAHAAKIPVLGVAVGDFTRHQLSAAGATLAIDSMETLAAATH